MSNMKETRKYTFSVEGETERWYLLWIRDQINNCESAKYKVSIVVKVQQDPLSNAKTLNPMSTPAVTHLCDYESNDTAHVEKFQKILGQLKKANGLSRRKLKYCLGYSNFAFELWIVLHKAPCNGSLANRTQYLSFINKIFNERFESLDEYKHEDNFKRCLMQLSLDDVKQAIIRSQAIMKSLAENGYVETEYKGFYYYKDNPSLTIWQSIETILKETGII